MAKPMDLKYLAISSLSQEIKPDTLGTSAGAGAFSSRLRGLSMEASLDSTGFIR